MRKLIMVTAMTMCATVLIPAQAQAVDEVDTTRLRNAVNSFGILAHERVFQRIANQNDGTRAAGTVGYDKSAEYVRRKLRDAGYDVTMQVFEFPFFQQLAPSQVEQLDTSADYESATFQYSGSGEVVGIVKATNDVVMSPLDQAESTSGCEASDFAPAGTASAIALIQRGTCSFGVKVTNAVAAGYDGVVLFNEGREGRTGVASGNLQTPFDIPVVGMSFADGVALRERAETGEVSLRIETSTLSELRSTTNVIADSPEGTADKVIVVGAHLDSVPDGPGINDNGSGTATVLETAIQLSKLGIVPRQKMRFAFWGAEELGAIGSTYYVDTLAEDELAAIYANLNFDTIGSRNFVRFVFDGDGSAGGPAGPPGSDGIEDLINEYFTSQELASDPTPFDGQSDYGAFMAVGIPAGGLFAGADGIKTQRQAELYGGTAGVAYDPCHHQACDNTYNVSTRATAEMADAAADAIMTLGRTKSGLYSDSKQPVRVPVPADTFDYVGGTLVR